MYDPATDTFTYTKGRLATIRHSHGAARLLDGRVLLVGGNQNVPAYSATAEIYDPVTQTFSPTGSMTVGRDFPVAITLKDGRVLVAGGGNNSNGAGLETAEIYDPASGTFKPASNTLSRASIFPAGVLLANGKVLISGGLVANVGRSTVQEIFDPLTNTFSPTQGACRGRYGHNSVLLPDGSALNALGVDASAELAFP